MTELTLVTGGTGFIGSATVRALVEAGSKVRVLDDGSRGAGRRLGALVADIELRDGDIRDAATVADAMEGVTRVVHLAYVNGTRFFYEHPELVLDVAIRGMLNVLDACRSNGVRDLVLASSSEVYQSPPRIPTDESAPLVVPDVRNARYSYGGGKITCELMALNWGRTGFDRVTIFRPHNIYGPDMGGEHVIPEVVLRANAECERQTQDPVRFPLQGDGSDTRSFMHIEDCARAISAVIDRGEHLGIYHVGNPQEVPIRRVVDLVFEHLGRKWEPEPGPRPSGGTSRRCPDITRLRGLGFEPKIGLSEGIPAVVDWYSANRDLFPQFERASK